MQHKQLYNGMFRTVMEEDFDDLGIAAAGQPHWPFTSNFGNYPKGEEFSVLFDVFSNGIFNSNSKSWAFQRHKAQALGAFAP
jgi:hypothetical protein